MADEKDGNYNKTGRCKAITTSGKRCKNKAVPGTKFCQTHHIRPTRKKKILGALAIIIPLLIGLVWTWYNTRYIVPLYVESAQSWPESEESIDYAKRGLYDLRAKLGSSSIERENDAFAYLENENYEKARELYSALVKIYPDDSYLHFNLALALIHLDDVDSAITHWRKCIELGDADYLTYANLGFGLLELGEISEAIIQFYHAYRLASEEPRPIAGLGYANLKRGDSLKAAKFFRLAISVDNKFVASFVGLGESLLRMGMIDAALDTLFTAIKLNPTGEIKTAAYFHLGVAYLEKEDYFSANKNFTRCLETDSAHYSAIMNKGYLLVTLDSCKAAVEVLKIGKRQFVDSLRISVNLARAYICTGDLKEAESEYKYILSKDTCSADGFNGLGMIAGNKGNDSLAVEFFRKALACDPYHKMANFNLGIACGKDKNWICAKAHLEVAFMQDPKDKMIRDYYLEAASRLMTEPIKINIQ